MTQHSVARRALDVAIAAALDAGRLIRFEAGAVSAGRVRAKGTNDFVTDVDERAQAVILSHVRAAFPGHAVLAEEDESADIRPAAGWQWIVDPIDGTTNFTHGVPPYAVSIALQYDARPEVGVVYDVSRDELFTALRGDGARANGRPIRVSTTDRLADALLTTGFPYRSFAHVDAYLQVLRSFFETSRGVRRPGSASVDLAWVAAGRFDGFFELGLSPWDVAAGRLLVEEAGGRVTDFSGSGDPVFSGQTLASNGRIHADLERAARPLRSVGA